MYPTAAWGFMVEKDKDKLDKAGFATPRGGSKNGYQNHVVRSNQVIIPYEKRNIVPTEAYQDGYVYRLLPEQYFQAPNIIMSILHVPLNVAWGHALCNTRLSQRECISLEEIIKENRKIGIIRPEGIETFGWISGDNQMIRSSLGAVWIQISDNMKGEEFTSPQPREEDILTMLQDADIVPILEDEDVEVDDVQEEDFDVKN